MQFSSKQIKNFWSKTENNGDCLVWTGSKINGYGRINVLGVVYLAHKMSAYLTGKITSPIKKTNGSTGEVVLHLCDNRSCVKPEHLWVGTQLENMKDAKRKGRKWYGEQSGEKNPKAKLRKKEVDYIRSVSVSPKLLSGYFGVSTDTIYSIRNNKTWTI